MIIDVQVPIASYILIQIKILAIGVTGPPAVSFILDLHAV